MRCATDAAANDDVVIRRRYHEPASPRNFQGLGTGCHLPKLISAGKWGGGECTDRCWQDLPPPPALIRAVAWYRHKRDELTSSGRRATRRGMCGIRVLLCTVLYGTALHCTALRTARFPGYRTYFVLRLDYCNQDTYSTVHTLLTTSLPIYMQPTIPGNGPRKPSRASSLPPWSKGVTSPPVSQRYSMACKWYTTQPSTTAIIHTV